jgi:histidinol-phosphatase (PHP family)
VLKFLSEIYKITPTGGRKKLAVRQNPRLYIKEVCLMSKKFTQSLHTHTFRCNHASGSEREYIETAIAAGFTTLGFSDHTPYVFRDGYYSGFRMKPEQQYDYVLVLSALREEYKGKIDIKIGYEAEYYPEFFEDYMKLITRYPVDYLILGQHFIENEMSGKYSGVSSDDEGYLKQYVDQVIEGMSTGVFTYVAHPDLMNYTGSDVIFEKHYSRLIEHAKKMNIPLEINLLGIRDHRAYPHDRFFKLCGEIGAEVCMGSDAHQVNVTADMPSFDVAQEMIEKYNLKWNEHPALHEVKL